ncbi:serine hydrolase [Kitasatospora sp. NPDC085895]|uniref:serine hydrolase n=1 Tax=Kitasatospora sp. NPDC085895 TaxID=3155057 RepID=UPI00344F8CD4
MTSARRTRTAARRRRRRQRRGALLVLLALAATGVWLHRERSDGGTVPVAAATASAAPALDPDAELAAALQDDGGHLAVAVLDTASGASAAYGTDRFVTAGIVKVDILAALLWRTGGMLTDDQRSAAALMIENSDNDATTDLFGRIGGDEGLDAANAAFGLTGTTAGTDGYWGLTTTTAEDQLRLLRLVFGTDGVLGDGSRAYLRKLMGLIAADQRWGVSAADDDRAVHLKNGWLPRTAEGAWVVNSIGRVVHDGRELLVAVLTDGSDTEEEGIALVESVAAAAADSLTSATPSATVSPTASPAASGAAASPVAASTQR